MTALTHIESILNPVVISGSQEQKRLRNSRERSKTRHNHILYKSVSARYGYGQKVHHSSPNVVVGIVREHMCVCCRPLNGYLFEPLTMIHLDQS